MKKRLTAQGPQNRKSYTVTLPLDWVKDHHLDKAREVELEVVGNKIVVSVQATPDAVPVIDLQQYPHTIVKVLQAFYRKGANELKMHYQTPQQLASIISIVNSRLLGYEIIEQKKNYVIIKDITKESSEDFNTVLRRIFLLLLELTEAQDPVTMGALDANIKRLVNYCQRILIKQGHTDYQNIPFYYNLLDRLEKLVDEFTWILPLPQKSAPFQQMKQCTRQAYELFYRFNPEAFDTFEALTYKLRRQMREKQKLEPFDIHLHNLARILNTIYADIFVLRGTVKKSYS